MNIRYQLEAKELKISGELVMSRDEWLSRGGTFRGTITQAKKGGFFTVRKCEKIGKPVSEEEFRSAKNFAMMAGCYMDFCLKRGRKNVRPCIPVFFRGGAK